jgi:hypothetical protein
MPRHAPLPKRSDKQRRITWWDHQGANDGMQRRLDRSPDAMRIRR